MSGSIEAARRPLTPLHSEGVCPCCRRKQDRPRLLGCLHTVCTPCLNQVEAVLRKAESVRGASTSSPLRQPPLRPLGRFLCPVCHSCHPISRFGISVLPLAFNEDTDNNNDDDREEFKAKEAPARCPQHRLYNDSYCLVCCVRLCQLCLKEHPKGHRVEKVQNMEESLGRVLKQTVKEIAEQLRGIEEDMGRIKAARKVGAGEAEALREKVAGFYSSHSALVAAHGQRLEERVVRQACL